MPAVAILDFRTAKVHIHEYKEVESDNDEEVEVDGVNYGSIEDFVIATYHRDTHWMCMTRLMLEVH